MSTTPVDVEPKKKTYVSNSSLSEIKRILLGKPPLFGDERYLLFGRELHSVDLQEKSEGVKLIDDEKFVMSHMLKALNADKLYQKLKANTLRETKLFGRLFGCEVKVILDIWKKKKHVTDLKTTSCDTEEKFIQKAVEYDYFRQGYIYENVTKVKQTFFVGIQKLKREQIEKYKMKPKVYHLCINDHPNEYREAGHETEFLIHYFQKYGMPKQPSE